MTTEAWRVYHSFAVETLGETAGHLVVAGTPEGLNIGRVDPWTGNYTILSDFTGDRRVGDGPTYLDLNCPWGYRLVGVAVETIGETAGHLVVVVLGVEAGCSPSYLLRVDPATGNRSVLSGGDPVVGDGTSLWGPRAIAVETLGETAGHLVVVDIPSGGARPASLLRVDPSTGNRTLLSGQRFGGETRGDGPEFDEPVAIAVETLGETAGWLVVVDQSRILRVDPATGDRTLLSSLLPVFLRGDCNADGVATGQVTDAVFLLTYNFLGGEEPPCLAACDANGDGEVEGQVTDAVHLLTHNFLSGAPPVLPFPRCERSTVRSDAALGCETAQECP